MENANEQVQVQLDRLTAAIDRFVQMVTKHTVAVEHMMVAVDELATALDVDAQPKAGHTCGECIQRPWEYEQWICRGMCAKKDSPACSAFLPRDPAPLPCPWCGAMPVFRMVEDAEGVIRHFVRCENPPCDCRPGVSRRELAHAIAAWNTRAVCCGR